MSSKFDLVVIGSGPGGYVCAIRAAQQGLKTAIVEREALGGVCLNVGCIPSKAMITAAHFLHRLEHDAPAMGIEAGKVKVNFSKLRKWQQSVCDKMSGGVSQLLKGNQVTVFRGEATMKSAAQVTVKSAQGSETVDAKHIVLATGSRPIEIPGFQIDEQNVLSSTGALALEEVPKEVVVVGGGYIGLEIGSYLAQFGSHVTVLEAGSQLLAGVADPECVQVVAKKLKAIGVHVVFGAKAQAYSKKSGRLEVEYQLNGQNQTARADKILLTVGRKPNTDQMNFTGLGIGLTERGFIKVDSQCRTSVPSVFAIGDVAGQPMLAHKASYEGVLVADVLAGQARVFDAKTVPAVIFTTPELASVGLLESECAAKGYSNLKVGKFPFAANGRAVSMQEADGFVKIIAAADTHVVLGVHIVGPEASNLISEAALAMEMGARLEDIALTIHPHPTLGETMMEAAEAALGHAIHIIQKPLRSSAKATSAHA